MYLFIYRSYGPVYYVVMAVIAAQILVSQVSLIRRGWRSPRRRGPLLVACYVLLLVYGVGYALRWPPAWESDMTITVGLFLLLVMEVILRTGLVPVNRGYRQLFAASTLVLRIKDHVGRTIVSTRSGSNALQAGTGSADSPHGESCDATGPPRDGQTSDGLFDDHLCADHSADHLIHTRPIRGGSIVWEEDISDLNRLDEQLCRSAEQLRATNLILAQRGEITKRRLQAQETDRIFTSLEAETASKTKQLEQVILSMAPDDPTAAAQRAGLTAVLLCYIKRRCNFYFLQETSQTITTTDLAIYLEELAGLSSQAGIRVLITCNATDRLSNTGGARRLSFDQAIAIYDMFYAAWSLLSQAEDPAMVTHLIQKPDHCELRLLLPVGQADVTWDQSLLDRVVAVGGRLSVKDLDDMMSLIVALPTQPITDTAAVAHG